MSVCKAPSCAREAKARGVCLMHYKRLRKTGDLSTPWKSLPILDRITRKVEVDESGCWLWTGFKRVDGYGSIGGRLPDGRTSCNWNVHRVVWELTVGPIPEGLTIDHLCRVRHCVNIDHLEPVTRAENTRRGNAPGQVVRRRRLGLPELAVADLTPIRKDRGAA